MWGKIDQFNPIYYDHNPSKLRKEDKYYNSSNYSKRFMKLKHFENISPKKHRKLISNDVKQSFYIKKEINIIIMYVVFNQSTREFTLEKKCEVRRKKKLKTDITIT